MWELSNPQTRDWLTMSVVLQVGELVAPLGNNTERIFEERDDDQETADGGEVTVSERC